MADRFPIPAKRFLSAGCATALLVLGGCASVIETPVEEMASAQTVMPIAKPGTEMTAYALPAPIVDPATENDGAQTLTAAIEATRASNAELAIASAAPDAATETAAVASAVPVPTSATPSSQKFMPASFEAAVMEPGFDTGEPEGLEQLVASHQIIPMAKPTLQPVAFAATQAKPGVPQASQAFEKSGTPIDALITKYAALYEIPEGLLHRVIKRESRYNPKAYSRGNYGLMQIRYNTAKGMGYTGAPDGLFDAETNIKYGAKYLRGAWMVAENQHDGAVRLYASGYYYTAKRKGLLEETGLK
ncbi:lytic transglycosylase domain-containing protein [Mycoplana sp. BE70]|uniref:lytic transglycosylase domain-containing protein n=1 Tax=Mycoplana sp. BE70 TaxID=2817775 RepID=UPI00386213BB